MGWTVKRISINGVGRVLGFVELSVPKKSNLEILRDHAAIVFGGEVAAGSDFGTAGDRASIEHAARQAEILQFRSREGFILEGRDRSKALMNSQSDLEKEAEDMAFIHLAA